MSAESRQQVPNGVDRSRPDRLPHGGPQKCRTEHLHFESRGSLTQCMFLAPPEIAKWWEHLPSRSCAGNANTPNASRTLDGGGLVMGGDPRRFRDGRRPAGWGNGVGCGPADRLGAAAAKVRIGVLKFGTVSWELDTLKYHRFDAANGVDLDVVHFAGEDATNVALQAGEVDVIVSDWLWVSRLRSEGADLTLVPYSTAVGASWSGRNCQSGRSPISKGRRSASLADRSTRAGC